MSHSKTGVWYEGGFYSGDFGFEGDEESKQIIPWMQGKDGETVLDEESGATVTIKIPVEGEGFLLHIPDEYTEQHDEMEILDRTLNSLEMDFFTETGVLVDGFLTFGDSLPDTGPKTGALDDAMEWWDPRIDDDELRNGSVKDMYCPHCDTEWEAEYEVDYEGALPPYGPPNGMNKIEGWIDTECPSCGKEGEDGTREDYEGHAVKAGAWNTPEAQMVRRIVKQAAGDLSMGYGTGDAMEINLQIMQLAQEYSSILMSEGGGDVTRRSQLAEELAELERQREALVGQPSPALARFARWWRVSSTPKSLTDKLSWWRLAITEEEFNQMWAEEPNTVPEGEDDWYKPGSPVLIDTERSRWTGIIDHYDPNLDAYRVNQDSEFDARDGAGRGIWYADHNLWPQIITDEIHWKRDQEEWDDQNKLGTRLSWFKMADEYRPENEPIFYSQSLDYESLQGLPEDAPGVGDDEEGISFVLAGDDIQFFPDSHIAAMELMVGDIPAFVKSGQPAAWGAVFHGEDPEWEEHMGLFDTEEEIFSRATALWVEPTDDGEGNFYHMADSPAIQATLAKHFPAGIPVYYYQEDGSTTSYTLGSTKTADQNDDYWQEDRELRIL